MKQYKAQTFILSHAVNGFRLTYDAVSELLLTELPIPVRLDFLHQRSIGNVTKISRDELGLSLVAELDIFGELDLSSMYCVPSFSYKDEDVIILEDGTKIINHAKLINMSVTSSPADETLTKIKSV